MASTFIVELSGLNGNNGFSIDGESAYDQFGVSVSSAGDVNGDGWDDFVVGAHEAGPNGFHSGATYVIYGRKSGFGSALELSTLKASDGFQINGERREDHSGYSVAAAGDINGDGYDDIIIGAYRADPKGNHSGAAYVVYGQKRGFGADVELSDLDGSDGFKINGRSQEHHTGYSVASAGDINGDGLDDFFIGAPGAAPNGSWSGAGFVVFGRTNGFSPELELNKLDGSNGFRLNGEAAFDYAGTQVAPAGDVNGDGIDDLLISAPNADPNGAYSGAAYVVFGRNSGFNARVELSDLNGKTGFQIRGENAGDYAGVSVASAGDVNGDGFDDILISSPMAGPNGINAGAAWVVFGKNKFSRDFDLAKLDGTKGFQLNGVAAGDFTARFVSSAGDVNGDGFDDIIIGAYGASSSSAYSGTAYVVYGKRGGFDAEIELADLNARSGFKINGALAYDGIGRSVSAAGDINGDGFDDVIIGADYASPNGVYSGAAYVIYGQAPTEAVTRFGTAIDNTIRGGNFNDTLKGLGGDDRLFGAKGKDKLVGAAGDDRLDGGQGADNMRGGKGDDTYIVDSARDSITEKSGNDTAIGHGVQVNLGSGKFKGVENAKLYGRGDLNLFGDNADNTLTGNSGANRLDGRAGDDTLKGGLSADRFVFKTGYDHDTALDFNARGKNHDVADLRGLKSVKNFNDLVDNHLAQQGNDVIIDGHRGDVLTLKNVNLAHLDAADFLI